MAATIHTEEIQPVLVGTLMDSSQEAAWKNSAKRAEIPRSKVAVQ